MSSTKFHVLYPLPTRLTFYFYNNWGLKFKKLDNNKIVYPEMFYKVYAGIPCKNKILQF